MIPFVGNNKKTNKEVLREDFFKTIDTLENNKEVIVDGKKYLFIRPTFDENAASVFKITKNSKDEEGNVSNVLFVYWNNLYDMITTCHDPETKERLFDEADIPRLKKVYETDHYKALLEAVNIFLYKKVKPTAENKDGDTTNSEIEEKKNT